MSELIKRYGPQEIMAGAMPDLPASVPPLFKDARNVQFADGALQPVAGQVLLVPTVTGEPVTGVLTCLCSGVKTAFFGTPTKLFKWDQTIGTVEIGSGFTGTDSDLWSIERWGNWVVATNGVDVPQIYKGVSFDPLAGTTFTTTKIFVRRSPFLLAFETSGGSGETGRYHWCDRDDVETWTPLTTNFAGTNPVRDIDSDIRAAIPFAGEIAFAASDSVSIASFIGFPNVFGHTNLVGGVGVVGKKAMVEAGRRLFGFGPRGLWVSDGNSKDYFANPQIQEFIFDDINEDELTKVVAWHNRLEESVAFFYPSNGFTVNNRGVFFNYKNRNWGIFSFGRNAIDDRGVFDFAISADENGNLFFQEAGLAFAPQAGGDGIMKLVDETGLIQFGFGYGGFGETPFGGVWEADV
jgi:hypothetical protein